MVDASMIDEGFTGALVIDLGAIARNYRHLRDHSAPAECAAVVKADAYGLGVERVAPRLAREGCTKFFVATLAEAEQLRGLVPDASIYVFDGVAGGEAEALAAARAIPVLNSLEQIERWGARGPAVLHVDTGMTRLGLGTAEVRQLAAEPARLHGLQIDYILTHLACADEPGHPLNRSQLARFDHLRAQLPPAPTSIGNSAAIFIDEFHRGDLVRPGIALYGGNPFLDRANPMAPVVTLTGRILQIRAVDEGLTVGYGATYGVAPPTRLAVVGVGYADGYPRILGNRGAAAIAGRHVPVVGRVSMDLLTVEVSNVPPAESRAGDWVELIGTEIGLDKVAAAADTISYEILTGLGNRLHREYRD
ncbi:MAG TPA: alanine racemase [Gammaproteobacteria bacterium]|nr:alanine racemase [Gammaproteobacteria bacterium]